MKDKEFLMIPGPTPTPQSALLALAKHPIGHRTAEFSNVFAQITQDLKWVFQTQQDVITFASSGTGAMEAAIFNTINEGDKVLCIVGGKFGQRWKELAKMKGAVAESIDVEWGKALDLKVLKEKLDSDKSKEIKAVCITHNETSTGVTNPLKEIAQIVNQHGALIIVDAVTSLGAINLEFDKWGIDIAVAGSQKGFMIPPGLAFIALSDKAWKAVDDCKYPSYYFNLKSARKNLQKDTTPYTPAVNLFMALSESLKIMKEEGIENIFNRHARLSAAIQSAIPAMGLKLYVDEPSARSNSISAILAPEGMNADDFRKEMKNRFDISLAGGQDHLKGKIFRIGHLGFCSDRDILAVISCMEVCLAQLGYNVEFGKGPAAASKTIFDMLKERQLVKK